MSPDARWLLKKAARHGVAITTGTLHVAALRRRFAGGPRVRVLTYHRFGAASRDPFCVGRDEFTAQMAWLAASKRAVALSDVEDFVAGRCALADGSVLVTIDDGCPSVYSVALPILDEFQVPAVVFLPAGEIRPPGDATHGDDERPDARMTWAEIRALVERGIAIGSHAWTHHSLGRMPRAAAEEQIVRSRTELERQIGRPVTVFAYPFGTRADYTGATRELLARAGYTCAFTSQHGSIAGGEDPFVLPRVKVEGGEGMRLFQWLVDGGLDGWSLVDRFLWRLQASGA